jgi:isocitrate dehydrogenase (NAD+)
MAMLLAVAAILQQVAQRHGVERAESASRAVYESVLEATAAGIRTPDLGGDSETSTVTNEVIARVRTKLEIWSTLQAD